MYSVTEEFVTWLNALGYRASTYPPKTGERFRRGLKPLHAPRKWRTIYGLQPLPANGRAAFTASTLIPGRIRSGMNQRGCRAIKSHSTLLANSQINQSQQN